MDIIVENYQSVVKAKVSVNGITVLRGVSNAGKTSFFRAVHAAMFNRFKSGIVRYGEEFCRVRIRFEKDGDVLTVVRRPTGSPKIKLGDKVWSKLNRDLPTEVKEFLNVGNLNVSNSEQYSLNFFSQFQPPLLAGFSSKKIMDILSASKAVDDLNIARRILDQNRERNRGAFDQIDSALTEAKVSLAKTLSKLDNYKNLSDITRSFKVYEISSSKLEDLKKLQGLILSLEKLDLLISKLNYCSKLAPKLEALKVSNNSLNVLSDQLSNYVKTGKKIKLYRELVSFTFKYESLDDLVRRYSELSVSIKDLNKVDARLTLLGRELNSIQLRDSLLHLRDDYRDLYSNIRSLSLLDKKHNILIKSLYFNSLIDDLGHLKRNLISAQSLGSNLTSIRCLTLKLKSLEKLRSKIYNLESLNKRNQELKMSLYKSEMLFQFIEELKELNTSIESKEDIIKNNLCPYCLRPMDEHDVKH